MCMYRCICKYTYISFMYMCIYVFLHVYMYVCGCRDVGLYALIDVYISMFI